MKKGMVISMNLLIRELKANRKALIIWSICMVLLVFSGMGKYTAYSSGGVSSDVFNKMPLTMKALLGIGSFQVTEMSGFFAFLFSYIEITVAIHAALLGNGIIAKEERDKTTEFIIVKPISRFNIITQKYLAGLFNIIVLNLITLGSSVMAVNTFNKGKPITEEILLFHISMFFVQLIFLFLGAFLATYSKKVKGSGSIAIGVLLATFMIAKFTSVTDKANFLNVLSPFKYFSYERIVNGDGLNIIIVLLSLVLTGVFLTLSYVFYLRRDLSI